MSYLKHHELWAYLEHFLTHMRWRAVGVLALMVLISLTEGVGLITLAPLLELIGLSAEGGTVGQLATFVAQVIASLGLPITLLSVLAFYVGVVVVGALLARWQAVASSALVEAYLAEVREELYGAVIRAEWLFFARQRASDLTHALTGEVDRIGDAAGMFLGLLVKLLIAGIYLSLAFALSPAMTLAVLACGGVLLLFVAPEAHRARAKGEAISAADEAVYAAVGEHLAGMKVAKAHGVEARHQSIFASLNRHLAATYTSAAQHRAQVQAYFTVGSALTLGVALYLAFDLLALSTAGVLMLLFLFSRLVPMLIGVQRGYVELLGAMPAFSRVIELKKRFESAAEHYPQGLPLTSQPSRLELQHELQFTDVSFNYGEALPVLRELNLTLEAGKVTAVVGSSGAGKSTLADLAVGLVAPTAGVIKLDGVALDAERRLAWRQRVGYVTQDTFLFHDTVRANIQIAREGAGDAVILEALQTAAGGFVTALPEGLETVLGDRGLRLSGGERQRLALARALVREPALLVLDEATSALDTENERRVQRAIHKLRGQVTLLIIAHRLSTVRQADVIHVLEAGQLVESGDWETLTRRKGGRFGALYEAQGLLSLSGPQMV